MEIRTKDDACILNFSSLEETINMYNFVTFRNTIIANGDDNGIFCEINESPFDKNVSLSVNSVFCDINANEIKNLILSYLN